MTVHALPIGAATEANKEAQTARPETLTLAIENMHCGGCLRSVERAALSVPGVASARASLAAKRVSVVLAEPGAEEIDIIEALRGAGFAAAPMHAEKLDADTARESYLLRRVAVAGFAAMNIMLLSVSVWAGRAGDMDPSLIALFGWLSALIALPTVVYAGQPFFASAAGALKGRRLNMDVPISLAIILATTMSLYQVMRGNDQVYFDAAVALLEQRRDPLPGENEHADRLRELADDIGRTVTRIHEPGCVVKDLEMGLVDFYGKHEGKTVFLCWQFGEAAVIHYHALDSGFESRQRLNPKGADEPPVGLLN